MYFLERAKIKEDRRHGRWTEVDLRNVKLATILTRYAEVYFYIRYPNATGNNLKGVLLSKIKGFLLNVDQSMTFQTWLNLIGNMALPFENGLLQGKVNLVKYAQAWHAGYHLEPVSGDFNSDRNIPFSMREDLLLTHKDKSLKDFTKKALVTVNGFFHPCDTRDGNVLIMGGGRNIYNSNDNQVGIYSFETIGDLKSVIINKDWVTRIRPDSPLYDGAYITLPDDIDLKNKSVLLVVGGYLNVLNDVYYNVSDRTFRVNFTKMSLLDRIFQSYNEMDLGKLNLFPEKDSPTLTTSNLLKNDDIILNYLEGTRSFFIIVDSPGFFQEYKKVEYLRLPGRSIDKEYDRLPMVGCHGRMMEYHAIREHAMDNVNYDDDRMYVLCSSLNTRNNYDNHQRPWNLEQSLNAGRNSYYPFKHESYHYRLMGNET